MCDPIVTEVQRLQPFHARESTLRDGFDFIVIQVQGDNILQPQQTRVRDVSDMVESEGDDLRIVPNEMSARGAVHTESIAYN